MLCVRGPEANNLCLTAEAKASNEAVMIGESAFLTGLWWILSLAVIESLIRRGQVLPVHAESQ